MVTIKVYPHKGKYKARIEGDWGEIADMLKTTKNSPEGERVGKFIDEEYLKQITASMDRPRAKRDNS